MPPGYFGGTNASPVGPWGLIIKSPGKMPLLFLQTRLNEKSGASEDTEKHKSRDYMKKKKNGAASGENSSVVPPKVKLRAAIGPSDAPPSYPQEKGKHVHAET